jgi:hypothetical protein
MVENMDGSDKQILKPYKILKNVDKKDESKWNSLKKSWKGYKINHRKGNVKEAKKFAKQILKLQAEMGLKKSVFMETKM